MRLTPYCTLPWLQDASYEPTRAEIWEVISANLCRCAGCGQIVEAVALVAVGERSISR
jgi:aerobic-type carbon monoxide dehydrogenase small subunit (CoxS/CutS family)